MICRVMCRMDIQFPVSILGEIVTLETVVSCQELKLLAWGLGILQGLILEKELP